VKPLKIDLREMTFTVFKKVAGKNDLSAGKGKQVSVDGRVLAIFNVDGKFYAIDGKCSHRGGPLWDGFLDGIVVSCPWHGSEFDLASGEVRSPPAKEKVRSYKVKIEGNDILVDV
jgi:nitrite reductase/ring-hydroxylating ferredoxin subunit